jgi:hypothetical protein
MWISMYLGLQCFCCTILRDVIFVEACSASVISMTCILQHAVVCWVTASKYQSMSYIDIVICVRPLPYLETWPPIYRGQERPVRDRLRVSQVDHHVYSQYTPCLTDLYLRVHLTPYSSILSPSSRTFVELTLVNWHRPWGLWALES